MNNKEFYKNFCETEGPNIPLFLQYWWMETVCYGKCWDVAVAYGRKGEVVAVLPYLIGSKCGLKYVLQPQLTQYNGPWYRWTEEMLAPGGQNRRLEFEKEAAAQLLAQLKKEKIVYFQQNFAPQVTNFLPFYWAGYKQTTRYTYRIEDISDPQKVFDGFDKSRRQRQIKRLEGKMRVIDSLSAEQFAQFHAEYWQSKGEKDLLSKDFIVRIIRIALSRRQGMLLGLVDEKGVLQAARFVAFDSNCAYSLLSALNTDHHENGASPLLFWEMIKRLSPVTKSFDFEGSMNYGVEQSYRLYGAIQTPYSRITKIL